MLEPRLGVLDLSDFQLDRVEESAVALLQEKGKCNKFPFERLRGLTNSKVPFSFTETRSSSVQLLRAPTTHQCLEWKIPKTGPIDPSEFCFVPAPNKGLPLMGPPDLSSLSLQIERPAGENFSIALDTRAPELPTITTLTIGIGVPRISDCSDLLASLTPVSQNLFKPLGRIRTDGKDYSRDPKPGQQNPALSDQHIPDSGQTYKRSYSETRNPDGSKRRQPMSVWDLILPLLQPPPFDLSKQEQVVLPAELLPHQPQGVHFLASREMALLGDGVQTGKTIQTIVAMKVLFQTAKIDSALVVCPIPLLIHWQKQLEKWAPELWQGMTVVRSTVKEQRYNMWRMPAHVYATNYETLLADYDDIVSIREGKGFGLIVADEIQRIKNPNAEISKKLKELGKTAKCRWGLSATPLENSVEDIVSIFEFLKPGLLKRNSENEDTAKRKIQPFFLRRRTADVAKHFKEPRHDNYFVEMEGRQLESYEQAFKDSVAELKRMGEKVTLTHALAKLQALKQLCNVHIPSGESAKLEWLEDTLDEIKANGDKVLLFTQYIEFGRDFLHQRLKKFGCVNYGEATTDKARRACMTSFMENQDTTVFLANPKVAGVGLPDLKAANYVIHFDHWWNPAIEEQANGRVLGIGQKKDAFIVHLWADNSIEGKIQAILARKRDLFGRVIDAQTNIDGTGLTEAELFELFGLQAPPKKPQQTAPEEKGRQISQSDRRSSVSQSSRSSQRETVKAPQELSPNDFEELIARLYRTMGYSVRKTQQTRDEGIDVIAIRDHPTGRDKLAIQCKRQEKPVGRPELQKLLGVIAADPSYSAGILVTSCTFTTDARRFAEQNARLRLVDKNTLAHLLVQNRVSVTQ